MHVSSNISTTCTHYNSVIMGTLKSQDNSGLSIQPLTRNPEIPFIPGPTNEISNFSILCDVIVTGGNWHKNSLQNNDIIIIILHSEKHYQT